MELLIIESNNQMVHRNSNEANHEISANISFKDFAWVKENFPTSKPFYFIGRDQRTENKICHLFARLKI